MDSRELALRAYRSNPSNSTFRRVESEYRGWLTTVSGSVLRRYPGLTGVREDVLNEGLLALSRSVRRFLWFCGRCGAPFLEFSDLRAHAAAEHRVRGEVELVSLRKFAEQSAGYAMKRTALRLYRPEVPSEFSEQVPDERWSRDVLDVELLVRRAELRMSRDALHLLHRVLGTPEPDPLAPEEPGLPELRDLLRDLPQAHLGYESPKEATCRYRN